VREEAIGCDCIGDTVPFSGTVSAINGSQITITSQINYGGTFSPSSYAGWMLTFISGALIGQSFPITASSGSVFTLSGYSGGAQNGDWAVPNIQFMNNEIYENEFDWDVINIPDPTNAMLPTAVTLWGCNSNNLVAGNHVLSGIAPFHSAYVLVAKGGMYLPSNNNTFEDNIADEMSSFNHFGARYYTNPAGWPTTPWSVGHIIRRNTVTLSTGYSTPVARDYQSLSDTQFEYLKDWDIHNNSFDQWNAGNNSPTITDPNTTTDFTISALTFASVIDNITLSGGSIRRVDGSLGGLIKKIDGSSGGIPKRFVGAGWQ
jgi:hypothetical protein